MTVYML